MLGGQAQRFEYEEQVGSQMRRLEAQLLPDIAESGEVRGFYATGIDITERSATEKTLRDLTDIFANTSDFVVQTDRQGTITYLNPASRRMLGIDPAGPDNQRNLSEFNTPATNRLYVDVINPAVRASGLWIGESTVFAAGKQAVPVSHMVIAHRGADGCIERYSAVMRDITAGVEAKRDLHSQTAVLRSVSEAIPAIVAVVGADGLYRFVNSAFERWIGIPRDQIIGRGIRDVLGPADHERSLPWIEQAMAGKPVNFEREYAGRKSTRHLAVSYIPLQTDDGSPDGFVSVAQDITSHRQEAQRLLRLSQRDALTGLLNRAGFEANVEQKVSAKNDAALALLYIDLDRFKQVNDQHGHAVGDHVLQVFSQRLLGLVRPTDTVARLGGDEFIVVLSGLREPAHANAVADKILAAAHAPFELGTLLVHIGANVGVAFGASAGEDWRALLARGDAMLYRAKQAGRGRRIGEAG